MGSFKDFDAEAFSDTPVSSEEQKPAQEDAPKSGFAAFDAEAFADEPNPTAGDPVAVSANFGMETAPDLAGRILRVKKRTGWDDEFIGRNIDSLEKEIEKADFDIKSFTEKSPVVAAWVGKSPSNFAAAQDDLPNLQRLEELLKRPKILWPRSKDQVAESSKKVADARFEEWLADQKKIREQTNKDRAAAGLGPEPENPYFETLSANVRANIERETLKQAEDVERFVAGTGKVGFLEKMKQVYSSNPATSIPFAADVRPLAAAEELYRATEAINEGTASAYQKELLLNAARMQAAASHRGESFWAGVGNILASVPAFGGEIAVSGGVYSAGKAGARKIGAEAAEKYIEKTLERVIKNPKWLDRAMVLRSVPAGAVGATAVATATGVPKIATGALDRMKDNGVVDLDHNGNYMYEVQTGTGETLPVSLYKSYVDQVAEVASEYTGAAFKFLDKPVADLLYGWWARKNPGKVGRAFSDYLEKAQFQGAIGESMEERVGAAIKAIGGSGEYGDILPSPEQLVQELVAFSVPGAGAAALSRVGKPGPNPEAGQIATDMHTQIADLVEQSKLRQRSQADHAEVVADLVEGSDAETTYIPTEAFRQYFQSVGQDPVEVAKSLGVDLESAEKTGTDLDIKTSILHSSLAGTPHLKALAKDVRYHPEDLTTNETNKYFQDLETIAEENQPPETDGKVQEPSDGEEVEKIIKSQLSENLVGPNKDKITPDKIDKYAKLWRKMAEMDAKITGGKAMDALEAMGFKGVRSQSKVNANKVRHASHIDWDKLSHKEKTDLHLLDPVSGNLSTEAWEMMSPTPEKPMVAVLSVNAFSHINDRFNHDAGDDLLRYVGNALKDIVPDSAKVGGDFRFFVKDQAEADEIADAVYSALPQHLNLNGNVLERRNFPVMATAGNDDFEAATLHDTAKAARIEAGTWLERKPTTRPEGFDLVDGVEVSRPALRNTTPSSTLVDLSNQMGDEARKKSVVYDEASGWSSRRQWAKAPRKRFIASLDLNKLGEVNRRFGKAVGTAYLKRFADIVFEVAEDFGLKDAEFFRVGGDEFYVQSDNGELLSEVINEAVEYCWSAEYKAEETAVPFRGIYFSAGVSGGLHEAEQLLADSKSEFSKLWSTGIARIGTEGPTHDFRSLDVRARSVRTRLDQGPGAGGDSVGDPALSSGRDAKDTEAEGLREAWKNAWEYSPIGIMRGAGVKRKFAIRLLIPKPDKAHSGPRDMAAWERKVKDFREIGVPVATEQDKNDSYIRTKQQLAQMFVDYYRDGAVHHHPYIADLARGYEEGEDVDAEFDDLYDYLADFRGLNKTDYQKKAYNDGKVRDRMGKFYRNGKYSSGRSWNFYGQGPNYKAVDVESENFKAWFKKSKVVDDNSIPKRVFHGARRSDRIKDRFLKSRAFSGPMQFFTDSTPIASNYASGKKDNSISEEDTNYANWYKIKPNGSNKYIGIDKAWWFLSREQREKVTRLAPRIYETDDGDIVLGDENRKNGNGGYDQDFKESRGNALAALVESWLNSGMLYNKEEKFSKVLKLAGVDNFTYEDPYAEYPGVYPVYLSIQNPLDTSSISDDVMKALKERAKKQRNPKEKYGVDQWDKRIQKPSDWIERLEDDQKNNTTHAWTSIPDWVTDTLKSLGYDGIKDTGGKFGGELHNVWIPFEPTQIKSALGNAGTYDPSNPNIYHQSGWHGSPYTFDRFDISKIGTGEGVQAYGWGLYVAGKKGVAKWYKENLSKNKVYVGGEDMQWIEDVVPPNKPISYAYNAMIVYRDVEHAINSLNDYATIKSENPEVSEGDLKKAINILESWASEGIEVKDSGKLYKVDIPEDDTMLDWDKGFAQQSDKVKKALINGGIVKVLKNADHVYEGPLENRTERKIDLYAYSDNMPERYAGELVGNGQNIYDAVLESLWSPENGEETAEDAKAASEHLESLGVTGIKYLDATSRGAGEGTHNYVIFDDKLIKILEVHQNKKNVHRGWTDFSNDEVEIVLTNAADLSTFLHEATHAFTKRWAQNYKSIQAIPAESRTQLQDRFLKRADALLKYLDVATFDDLFLEVNRDKFEKLAVDSEAYFASGKAPSVELADVFAEFRNWLLRIYKRIQSMVHPEVTDFFDAILATDEEIEVARSMRSGGTSPLLGGAEGAEKQGLDAKKAAEYQTNLDRERDMAERIMAARISYEKKEREQKEFNDKRNAIKAEVEAEVDAEPFYAFIKKMQEQGQKIDPRWIKPPKLAAKLKRMYPTVIGNKDGDGYPPLVMAEMGGFPDEKALIDALRTNLGRSVIVEARVNSLMQERFPKLLEDAAALREAAEEAVHNEYTAKRLHMELEFLAKKPVDKSGQYGIEGVPSAMKDIQIPVPSLVMLRAQAEKVVGSLKINRIRPDMYKLGEVRSAREAGRLLAMGDLKGAYAQKEKELLNHELYRSAVEAKRRVEASTKLFEKVKKGNLEDLAKTRDVAYVQAARSILSDYRLLGYKAEAAAESYIEHIKDYDPDLYSTIGGMIQGARAGAGDWRECTYNDYSAMVDVVQALWDQARETRTYEIRGKKLETDDVAEEMIEVFSARAKKRPAGEMDHSQTAMEKAHYFLLETGAWMRRVRSWVDAMDLGDINGVMNRGLYEKAANASFEYRDKKEYFLKKYEQILKPIEKTLTSEPIVSTELGYTFKGKAELMGAIAHTGNPSSFRKLIVGRGWGYYDRENGVLVKTQWDAFIKRMWKEKVLTEADYKAIQSIWDLFDEIKPETQKAHRRMFGWFFGEIKPESFATPWGTFRGGYMPAKVDPAESSRAEAHKQQQEQEGFGNSYSIATTGKGFTKMRDENYAEPLLMDLSIVPGAIDWQLRFTYIEPHIREIRKLLWNFNLEKAIDQYDRSVRGAMLMPWLQRIARQSTTVPFASELGTKVCDGIRRRFTLTAMFINILNTVEQYTSGVIAATKVSPKHLAKAAYEFHRRPFEVSKAINAKSAFMRQRSQAQVVEVQKRVNNIITNPNAYQKTSRWLDENSYILQVLAQKHVDNVIWRGAYNESLEKHAGMDFAAAEEMAIREADRAVDLTQGSFNPESVSAYESGNPLWKMLTTFTGYFINLGNLGATAMQKFAREGGFKNWKNPQARELAMYTVTMSLSALMSAAMRRALKDGDWDDDGDGWVLDDIAWMLFGALGSQGIATLPVGIKEAISASVGKFTEQPWDDNVRIGATSSMDIMASTPNAAWQVATGEAEGSDYYDLVTGIAMTLGIPLPTKLTKYGVGLVTGDTTADTFGEVAKGVLTGK